MSTVILKNWGSTVVLPQGWLKLIGEAYGHPGSVQEAPWAFAVADPGCTTERAYERIVQCFTMVRYSNQN